MTYQELEARYEILVNRKNTINYDRYNGIYERWNHAVLTRNHIPPFWMYDPNPAGREIYPGGPGGGQRPQELFRCGPVGQRRGRLPLLV